MVSDWKKIKARESPLFRRMRRVLIDYIGKHPLSYPLNIEELMKLFGFEYNGVIIGNYKRTQRFMISQRKQMNYEMTRFLKSGQYEEYLKKGLSEEEIFRKFVDTMLSYEVIPLYSDSDDDYKYKLLDLPSYFEMLNSRIRKISTEFEHKINIVRSTARIAPKETRKELGVILDAPDEVQRFLEGRNTESKKDKKKV